MLPDNVAVVPHTLWLTPASETVGLLLIIVTSASSVQPLLCTVQRKMLLSGTKLLTPVSNLVSSTNVAEPRVTVHSPEPPTGNTPDKVAVLSHTVWSKPASAVNWLLVIVTSV